MLFLGNLPVALFAIAIVVLIVVGLMNPPEVDLARSEEMKLATAAHVQSTFPDLITPSADRFQFRKYDFEWKYWVFRFRPTNRNDRSIDAYTQIVAASGWRQVSESYQEAAYLKPLKGGQDAIALVRWRRRDGEFEVFAAIIKAGQDPAKWWKDVGIVQHMTARPAR